MSNNQRSRLLNFLDLAMCFGAVWLKEVSWRRVEAKCPAGQVYSVKHVINILMRICGEKVNVYLAQK